MLSNSCNELSYLRALWLFNGISTVLLESFNRAWQFINTKITTAYKSFHCFSNFKPNVSACIVCSDIKDRCKAVGLVELLGEVRSSIGHHRALKLSNCCWDCLNKVIIAYS